jgi:hypothetical protein
MTRTQFYSVISAMNSFYHDCHTEILWPTEELEA